MLEKTGLSSTTYADLIAETYPDERERNFAFLAVIAATGTDKNLPLLQPINNWYRHK